jgi:hypothetical protein
MLPINYGKHLCEPIRVKAQYLHAANGYPFQGHASTITESGRVYVLSNQLTLRECILCYTHLVTFQVSEKCSI